MLRAPRSVRHTGTRVKRASRASKRYCACMAGSSRAIRRRAPDWDWMNRSLQLKRSGRVGRWKHLAWVETHLSAARTRPTDPTRDYDPAQVAPRVETAQVEAMACRR